MTGHRTVPAGTTVVIAASFENVSGTPTNPATVTLYQRTPAGVASNTTSGFTNTGAGAYERPTQVTEAGTYWWDVVGAGNSVDQTVSTSVRVRPSKAQ